MEMTSMYTGVSCHFCQGVGSVSVAPAPPRCQSYTGSVAPAPPRHRRPTGTNTYSSFCRAAVYSFGLIVSLFINICLFVFILYCFDQKIQGKLFWYIFGGNSPDGNPRDNDSYIDVTRPTNDELQSCSRLRPGSVCLPCMEHRFLDYRLKLRSTNFCCSDDKLNARYMMTTMKLGQRNRNSTRSRSYYFTNIDVAKINSFGSGVARVPIMMSEGSGVTIADDAFVVSRTGTYLFSMGLTLNLHPGEVYNHPIKISVMRESVRGIKKEILQKTVSESPVSRYTFDNVILYESLKFDVFDKVYVLISASNSVWKYKDASWIEMLEV